jgi:aminoglycoside phosphotransferase (APT) family kinase protein
MHADDLSLSMPTARALLHEQFPELRDRSLTMIETEGTVHAIVRVGDDLVARFPRRPADPDALAADLVAAAHTAASLAEATRFATPRPVGLGRPGHGYPLRWSLQTWIPGDTASTIDIADSLLAAEDLAEFVATVRTIPVGDRRLRGTGRGGHLPDHDDWVEHCLARSAGLFDVDAVRRRWDQLRRLPDPPANAMAHGDLTPGNVVVADERINGVIDVDGLGPADPALDLVGAWHLFDERARQRFREALGVDTIEWHRGMAWALEQALGAAWYYETTNATMHRMGVRTIARILTDDGTAAL